jgi:hypothetical protein
MGFELPASPEVIAAIAVGVMVLLVFFAALVVKNRRRVEAPADLTIRLAELSQQGPPADRPQLACYSIPVRLAAVVLAPAGRSGRLPSNDDLPEVIDSITPELMEVVAAHQPLFRRWPPQLSSQGFTQLLLANVPLPGDGGKGTPWCVLTGRIEARQTKYLIGLVLRADKPNSLGQHIIDQPAAWLDVLRVKQD